MAEFKLPDLGEGVTEAEIERWLVKEGEPIKEDDPLVEVITDKATAEIPSPYEGVVSKIHVPEGKLVSVGTTLVTITDAGTLNEPDDELAVSAPSAVAATSPITPPPPPSPEIAAPTPTTSSAVKAMPPVRKLARELDVDLGSVSGSGPQGRILREDVEEAARSGDGARGPQPVERREPLRGVRRRIAQRMTEAHRAIPPVTHVEECDVTELDATRRLANERSADAPRLTFLPFIVKAVVAALKQYPALNASLDEENSEVVYHDRYDIGIAVDTPQGLIVPVLRDADQKGLRAVAAEIERLANAAREGKIQTSELTGGTFTITSPGPFGGLMATPIIMAPQAAILGVHRAIDRPVVRDGQIVVRKIMNLSITFDHRILDGMIAAKFVLNVVKLLEHPAVLALES